MAREIFTLHSGFGTDNSLEITIEGESNIPFWNHDLKVKAILKLLESIDIKHYYEDDKSQEAYDSYNKIIEAAKVAYNYDIDID